MTLTRWHHRGHACIRCALIVILLWPVAAAAQPWVATDIFEIAGVTVSSATANAVSDTGQVVGSYRAGAGETRAFSWTRSGGFVDLGTLGESGSTEAYGVNNAGQVVGVSSGTAFLWSPATGMLNLRPPPPCCKLFPNRSIAAYDINNAGHAVGYYDHFVMYAAQASIWTTAVRPFEQKLLGSTAWTSSATAVNDSRQVVGWQAPSSAALLWSASGETVPLGTLGGTASSARGLNETGQVVGWAYITGDAAQHAFSWTSGGGMVSLGTLGGTNSSATGVNDAGLVVGAADITGNTASHAFARVSGGAMVDLGTLGGTSSEATAVNNAGQVVGWATNAAGERRAVIWSGPWKTWR